jgi:hypothetical protein
VTTQTANSPVRIAVLGCSGSGKTTLAAAISEKLGLPCVATDHAFWTADWRPRPAPDVRSWLAAVSSAEHWVLDGNFDDDRDLLWARADLAVWLDLPKATTLWRVLRRNLGWWIARRPVWGAGRMTLAKALGGVRHAALSHGPKRRAYPAMLAEFPELAVVRLRSPRDVDAWLAGV